MSKETLIARSSSKRASEGLPKRESMEFFFTKILGTGEKKTKIWPLGTQGNINGREKVRMQANWV